MVNRRGRKRGALVGTRSQACKGTKEENAPTKERVTRNSRSGGRYFNTKTDADVEDEMVIEKSIRVNDGGNEDDEVENSNIAVQSKDSSNEDGAMKNSNVVIQSKDEAKTTESANDTELVDSCSVEDGSNDTPLAIIADNDEEGNKLEYKDKCEGSNDDDVGEALKNSCIDDDDQIAETIKNQETLNNQQKSSAMPRKGEAHELSTFQEIVKLSAQVQQSDSDKSMTERKIDEMISEENSVNDSSGEEDATENVSVAIQNKNEGEKAGTAKGNESINSCNVEVGSDDASLPSTAENDEEGDEVDSNNDDDSMESDDEDDDDSEASDDDEEEEEEETVENIKDQKKLKKQQKSPSKPKKGEACKLSKFQGTEKLTAQGQQSDTTKSATKNKRNNDEPEKEAPPAKKRLGLDEKFETLVEERKEERESRSLFLKNLPPNTTSEQLKKLSTEIIYVRIPMENGKNLKSLYAFIEFENREACDRNYKQLLGKTINKKKFLVDFCGERSKYKKKKKEVQLPVNKKRLFIPNLPTEITADELRQHIPDATNFHPRIRGTKRYMFISFENEEKAQKAFEEAGKLEIHGKKLTVLFAYRKKGGRRKAAERQKRRKPKIIAAVFDEEEADKET